MYVLTTTNSIGQKLYYSGLSVYGFPYEDKEIGNAVTMDFESAIKLKADFNNALKALHGNNNVKDWMTFEIEKI